MGCFCAFPRGGEIDSEREVVTQYRQPTGKEVHGSPVERCCLKLMLFLDPDRNCAPTLRAGPTVVRLFPISSSGSRCLEVPTQPCLSVQFAYYMRLVLRPLYVDQWGCRSQPGCFLSLQIAA